MDMRIVLAVPVHNEIEYGPHIWQQLDDALEMDYDEIVILDDASDDGTWDVVLEYARKHNNIHAFRNEQNSILNFRENRWKTLIDQAAKLNPTWINVRAADQTYSHGYKKNIRQIVEKAYEADVHLVLFPLAHLWRSKWWYRTDNQWGYDIRNPCKKHLWRFNKNYSYEKTTAKFHQGGHFPENLGFEGKIKVVDVNQIAHYEGAYPFVVLHWGHTTHEKKVAKFHWTMKGSVNAVGVPRPADMPPVRTWLSLCGYPGFFEFGMTLRTCPQVWFEEEIPKNPDPPKIESFYDVIKEYNSIRAEEYLEFYERTYQRKEIGEETPTSQIEIIV